ncbi:MAG: hypothetical protein NVS3B10_15250 [Polyangiales bacterium]
MTSLRILAVSADVRWSDSTTIRGQAYAAPGEEVTLRAEWYHPPSDARPRQWIWLRCVDPESTTVAGCIAAIGKEAQQTRDLQRAFLTIPVEGADVDVVKLTVPADALTRLSPEGRRNATVGVVTLLCPGKIELSDLSAIDSGSVPVACREYGTGKVLPLDQWVAGIKRIFVRARDRNENPRPQQAGGGTGITWDGKDWPEAEIKEVAACETDGNRYDKCKDADHHDVALTLTPDSFEQGIDENGLPFHEQVIVEYYSTEGLFDKEVRIAQNPGTAWVARSAAKGAGFDGTDPLTMWFVAHDSRGGTVWAERQVRVRK